MSSNAVQFVKKSIFIKKFKIRGAAAPQLSIVNSTLSIAGRIMLDFNYFIDRQNSVIVKAVTLFYFFKKIS